MNMIGRIWILLLVFLIPLFCTFLTAKDDSTQEFYIDQYFEAVNTVQNLISKMETELQEGNGQAFLSRFRLKGKTAQALRHWSSRVCSEMPVGEKNHSVFMDFPVLGVSGEKILVVNAAAESKFNDSNAENLPGFDWPPLILERKEGEWVFSQAVLDEFKLIPEGVVRKAEFTVEPSNINRSVSVHACIFVDPHDKDKRKKIPVYLCHPFAFKSIAVNGRPVQAEVEWGCVSGIPAVRLLIPVAEDEPVDDPDTLVFKFQYEASYRHHPFGRKPVGFSETAGFVLPESFWYPHFSTTWEAFPNELGICVPVGLMALAGGILIDRKESESGIVYRYRMDDPEWPYFLWGDYKETTVEGEDLKIMIWIPSEGSIDPQPLGDLCRKIFRLFLEYLPPPRLDSFRLVAVARYGGYGPSGNLLLQDRYFSVSEAVKPDTLDLLAHELSHSWVNSIAPPGGKFRDFLAEGLATFLGAKAVEKVFGGEAADKIWEAGHAEYFASAHRAVPPLALDDKVRIEDNPMFRAVVYRKGGFFFRELETWLGETTLVDSLKEALDNCVGKVLRLESIVDCLVQKSGEDVRSYVDRMLTASRLPDFYIAPDDSGKNPWVVKLHNRGAYSPIPVVLAAEDVSGIEIGRKTVVMESDSSAAVDFSGYQGISGVRIDPERRVLQEEIRNDLYPNYILPHQDRNAVMLLMDKALSLVLNQDAVGFDTVLAQSPDHIDPGLRRKLLTAVKSVSLPALSPSGPPRIFGCPPDSAEAVVEVQWDEGERRQKALANYVLVKEQGEWYICMFNIKQ